MGAFDPVAGWFDKGFAVAKQKPSAQGKSAKRDAVRAGAGSVPSRGGVSFSAGARDNNVRAVLKGAPEVMVKIPPKGHNSGTKSLKDHLDYISRNGKVTLTDEEGQDIDGRTAVRDLVDSYKAAGYPPESNRREFLHVVFSMPLGTPEKALKTAVAKFAAEEFGNRHYVMALHDDKDHTHVHLAVATRDKYRADEARLSPRPNDLYRWRQGFAEKLRDEGVEAAASQRRSRFQFQKSEHSTVRQIRKDNPKSAVYDRARAEDLASSRAMRAISAPDRAFVGPYRPPRTARVVASQAEEIRAALAAGQRPQNPAAAAMERNRAGAVAGWRAVERLAQERGDTVTARQAGALAERGQQQPKTRAQALFDGAKGRDQRAEAEMD